MGIQELERVELTTRDLLPRAAYVCTAAQHGGQGRGSTCSERQPKKEDLRLDFGASSRQYQPFPKVYPGCGLGEVPAGANGAVAGPIETDGFARCSRSLPCW